MKEDLLIPTSCDGLPMSITLAGISYCDGSYHIRRTKSSKTVIEYVLEGEGYVTVDGKDIPVTADKIYILKKGIPHNYYSCSENPWRKIFINISGDLALKLLFEYNLQDDWLFDGEGLKHLFEEVASIVKSGNNTAECHAKLSAIYTEIIAKLSIIKQNKSADTEVTTVKEYIDNNMNRIVKNKELADVVFRSPDYVIKHFFAQYGVTPYEYQLTEKMNIAKRLLKNTFMSVNEISVSLGYEDSHYFSGLFKQRCGFSPRAYRSNNNI